MPQLLLLPLLVEGLWEEARVEDSEEIRRLGILTLLEKLWMLLEQSKLDLLLLLLLVVEWVELHLLLQLLGLKHLLN